MDNSEIFSHIDHTRLNATATWQDIARLCDEAIQYRTASVCIPPSYVRRVHEVYGERVRICTVIGFPLGYSTTETKVYEALRTLDEGAAEIDMVVNLGDVKNGDFGKVTAEISALKKAAGKSILKVIIETCALTQEEKAALCGCVTNGGADYIKTSTGFGTAGANIADVELFKKHIGKGIRIKAAGGVRTRADLEQFLEAGCDRIGTSSAIAILTTGEAGGY